MVFAQDTKLKVPRAGLPTSSTKRSVKMPVDPKSESSSTQSSVKKRVGPKSESSSTNSGVKMPVGQSSSRNNSVKIRVGPKSGSSSTHSSVKMPVAPKSEAYSCGKSGERPLKQNSTNPKLKASRNTVRVFSKTPRGLNPKNEISLLVESVNAVDDDQLNLDLFKGQHYDRALAELNLQPAKQSPNSASSVVTHEKPEIVSPINGSRYNPIAGEVLVLNRPDATAGMSCGIVAENLEICLTDIDSEEKCLTPSNESTGSNCILSSGTPPVRLNDRLSSYVGEKLCFSQQKRQEWDRISSHSSVLTQDFDGTETQFREFDSNGLSFQDFLSEANKVGDHLLACSEISLMHRKFSSHSHGKLAPRRLDYEDETSFTSTMEKSLMRLDDEMCRTLKALKDKVVDNKDLQDPLYWPLNPESYWTIE